MQRSAHKRKNELPIWSTAGTLYEVLMDKERTLMLKKAIRYTIKKGAVVADIGTGSGILACFAIMAGARTVYAIEKDPSNFKAASTVIQENNMTDVVKLIQGDAIDVELPEKVDVLICELMSTALLDEPQIRLMNHGIKKFMKKGGITIPKRAITFIEYVTTNYQRYGFKLRVPQYEWAWIPSVSKKLSKTTTLFKTDFTKINKENIHCSGKIKIMESGLLNGIRLSTETCLTNEIIHTSSMGFCPRVVIPIKSEFMVNIGDEVSYDLSYKAGYGYASVKLDVFKSRFKHKRREKNEKRGDIFSEKIRPNHSR